MPTPRLKSINISNHGKSLLVFYAGRNSAGMTENAKSEFQRITLADIANAEIKETFYNKNPQDFYNTIEALKVERNVFYAPKVEGIGERWTVMPPLDEEPGENLDAVLGLNSTPAVPPSLDPQQPAVHASDEESNIQKHEIIHPESGVRTTFDTDGPPDWGGQEVPEGYRRIDGDPVVEGEVVNHDSVEGGIKYDPELIEPSQLSGETASGRPSWIPDDYYPGRPSPPRDPLFEPRQMKPEGQGVMHQDYPESPAYTPTDIIVHEPARPVSQVHGIAYGEGDYAKGDQRYVAEDGKLDRPQEFGRSEYDRARDNIRSINLNPEYVGWSQGSDEEYAAIPNTNDTSKTEESEDNQDDIDTGKLLDPRNMDREMEELRRDPNTEDHGSKQQTSSIPPAGRRSSSFFGVTSR